VIPTYAVRLAVDDDVPALVGLRRHAEQWLHTAGIEQWTRSAYGARVIKEWVYAGSTFVVETDTGETIGTLSLDSADLEIWTEQERSQPALHLYKFIIRSDHRGTGLGDVLLDWACHRAELAGSLWLRLDCWRDNIRLHDYYLRRGFRYLETRTHPVRMSGAMFERPANVRLATDAHVRLIDRTLEDAALPGRPSSPG